MHRACDQRSAMALLACSRGRVSSMFTSAYSKRPNSFETWKVCSGPGSYARSRGNSWRAFCSNLQKRNTTQLKRFTLICDCKDRETGLEVVDPLRHLPTLDYASIRLGQSFQRDLYKLAEDTANHLTHRRAYTFPFVKIDQSW